MGRTTGMWQHSRLTGRQAVSRTGCKKRKKKTRVEKRQLVWPWVCPTHWPPSSSHLGLQPVRHSGWNTTTGTAGCSESAQKKHGIFASHLAVLTSGCLFLLLQAAIPRRLARHMSAIMNIQISPLLHGVLGEAFMPFSLPFSRLMWVGGLVPGGPIVVGVAPWDEPQNMVTHGSNSCCTTLK